MESALNPQSELKARKYPPVPAEVYESAKQLWLLNRRAKPSDVQAVKEYFKKTWPDNEMPPTNEKLGYWVVSWSTQVGTGV